MDFDTAGDIHELETQKTDVEETFPETQRFGEDGPTDEHLEVLLKCFGHKCFRSLQWEIVNAIIASRRDVCAVMATGYGKSLCYQYPSMFLGGITLVISPLISLMKDQILSLTVSNIPACLLGSAQTNPTQVVEGIFKNAYNLVYLTPEFCSGSCGQDLLQRMRNKLTINLIAIDEAHCISSWGHDFRLEYRKLNCLREIFPHVPILAVTATATPQVRDDIATSLRLSDPLYVCSGFDRPNLYFEVHYKTQSAVYHICKALQQANGNWDLSGATIVYCLTRKKTEEIAHDLGEFSGIKCAAYHAGLPLSVRNQVHEDFVRDKIKVVVATIAFGMGIDKPDVRTIIHFGASKSIEAYYQEVGRAGRDGLPAKCICFFDSNDFAFHRSMPSWLEADANARSRQNTALNKIEQYMNTRKCRRNFILNYFTGKEDMINKPVRNCCDNCNQKCFTRQSDCEIYEGINEAGQYNFTDDVRSFLQAVKILQKPFALGTYISFLRGTTTIRLPDKCKQHPLYGSGKLKSDIWWKTISRMLIEKNFLQEIRKRTPQNFTYFYLEMTAKGNDFFKDSTSQFLQVPPQQLFPFLKRKPPKDSSWLTVNRVQPSTSKTVENDVEEAEGKVELEARMGLYRQLINKRADIAQELDCMPYMIASNATLMKLARYKPQSVAEMRSLRLDAFTETKLAKFGPQFLKIINPSNEISAHREKDIQTIRNVLKNVVKPPDDLPTIEVSFGLLMKGLTVEEIAQRRNFGQSEIVGHLIAALKMGYPVKLSRLGVTEEKWNIIFQIIKKRNQLTLFNVMPILSLCPSGITYEDVNAVLGYFQVRQSLKNLNVPYEDFEEFNFDQILNEEENAECSDEDLSVLCDLLEEEIRKDTDDVLCKVSEQEEGGEPAAKREKIDVQDAAFADIADEELLQILDSPSQQVVLDSIESDNHNKNSMKDKKSCDKTTKNRKVPLPPWLATRKLVVKK